MRIFLDEWVDRRLARHIVGHDVKTERDMGWTSIKNGELLKLAAAHFEVFLTVGRNLAFQQNFTAQAISVIVLRAKSNRLSNLLPLVPNLLIGLSTAPKGAVTFVEPG